ncbi:hypothetical protein SprV_0802542800 [Sparganum proliferum]
MLRYENGGLLNVFLMPVPSSGSQNGTSFDIQKDASVMSTSLMHMVMEKLEKSDLAVLAALPEDLGGGEAAVKEAIANPNHEGQLIVAFIVCLVFATLGLLAIFVCSLICCCCTPSGRHYDSDEEDEISWAFLSPLAIFVCSLVCGQYDVDEEDEECQPPW